MSSRPLQTSALFLGLCCLAAGCDDGFSPRASTIVGLPAHGGGTPPDIADTPCEPVQYATDPKVIDPDGTEDVVLTLTFQECYRPAELRSGSDSYPFTATGPTTSELRIEPGRLLALHEPLDPHPFAGYIEIGSSFQGNGFLNVRTSEMPDVPVTELAADAQRTPHVVNLLLDRGWTSGGEVLRRFYELMGDDYQFTAIVNDAHAFSNRSFVPINNSVTGIGLNEVEVVWTRWFEFDAYDVSFLDDTQLEGLLRFPSSNFFDLGSPGLLHEIGHRWMNDLSEPSLARGRPHWPLSSLADGIMSFNIPGSLVGAGATWTLVQTASDELRIDCAHEREYVYNDLELYLMGLLPATEVGPHVVLEHQVQPISCGSVWSGPMTTVTIDDVIASDGERLPAFGDAPTSFNLATIVVSTDRLLTPHELAFFDHMAARGAATERLRYSEGFVSGVTNPFFLATGERATLRTELFTP